MKKLLLMLSMCLVFAGSTFAATIWETSDGCVAAKTELILAKALNYATKKDFRAVQVLLSNKEVFNLGSGFRVEVLERRNNGRVRVRIVDMTLEFWVLSSHLRKRV